MATAASSDKKEAVLNFRAKPLVKKTIEEAAAALGQTLSDFVVTDAYARAKRVLEDRGVMVLEDADRQAFVDAFLNPPAVPARLRRAAKVYQDSKPE